MNNYHINIKRWAQMDILNQMGNIGSEVGRAIKAKSSRDDESFNDALARAVNLFDATAEVLVQQKSPRVREVLLAKYQFLSLFFAKRRSEDPISLENYFMQFALAARMRQFNES